MDGQEKQQIPRKIYHAVMAILKFTLNLEEMSYRERGRNDPRFKTFKQQLMQETYDKLRSLFGDLADLGLVVKTPYQEDVINGYKETLSGGSGFLNSEELDRLLSELPE